MRRREFITLVTGTVATWPLAAHAQQPVRVRRIGVILPGRKDNQESQRRFTLFREGLKELGWAEDINIRFDVRWGGEPSLAQDATAEILALRPDVILANGSSVLRMLQQRMPTTPIVFVQVFDPVAVGFVTNLAKPGGNVTGFVNFEYATAGKWIALLREFTPNISRLGIIHDPLLGASAGL